MIAHRGGAGLWPENTTLAVVESARAGYDGAEIDVQLTHDGKLVVFHDFIPGARTCRDQGGHPLPGMQRPLHEWTYAELAILDVGSPESRPAGISPARRDVERIPLLSDMIAAIRSVRGDFRLFVELKTSFMNRTLSAAPEAVAEAAIAVLREANYLHNAVFVGFDWPGLLRAKWLSSAAECWFTTEPAYAGPFEDRSWAGGFDPRNFGGSCARAIKAAGGEGWFAHYSAVSAGSVDEAHALGLKAAVWTVNEPSQMRDLVCLGVDAICSDRPDRLAEVVAG